MISGASADPRFADGGYPPSRDRDIADAFAVMVDDGRAPDHDVERPGHFATLLALAFGKTPHT